MLYVVAKFFDLKISQLFPFGTLLKVIIPSATILVCTRLLLNVYDFSNILTFIIGGCIYGILFLLMTKLLKLDYISIIKPIIKR